MNDRLSDQQLADFRARLQTRRQEVTDELRRILLDRDEQHYADLAGRVHDAAEESVADLLADLDIAETDRLVDELQDIDAAKQRISEGSYGICIDCEAPVGVERLAAYPTAKRCIRCQTEYETARARTGARPAKL